MARLKVFMVNIVVADSGPPLVLDQLVLGKLVFALNRPAAMTQAEAMRDEANADRPDGPYLVADIIITVDQLNDAP